MYIYFIESGYIFSLPASIFPLLSLPPKDFVLGEVFEFSWKEAIELFVRTAIKIVGCWTKAIEVEG